MLRSRSVADLRCRARGVRVIHTREGQRPNLADCPPAKRRRGGAALRIGDQGPMGRILVDGEPGNEIVPALAPLPGRDRHRETRQGRLLGHAPGRHPPPAGHLHLLLAGVTAEVCVQTTMRETNDHGYECLLIEDPTESYFPEFKRAAVEMIRAPGGIAGSTAPLVALRAALR
jgi:nicotinamidase-related amidase